MDERESGIPALGMSGMIVAADGEADPARVTRRGILGRLGALAGATGGVLALTEGARASSPKRISAYKRISVSAHGSSFHVEGVERASRVVPYGWGLAVSGWNDGNPKPLWVHAVIPAVGVWQSIAQGASERDVRLTAVYVAFTTSGVGNLHISNLDVWDGPKRIAANSGLHQQPPLLSHQFSKPVRLAHYALGLSIGITFPVLTDPGPPGPPPPPSFVFNYAWANLSVRGL